jgi:hypothetical protein
VARFLVEALECQSLADGRWLDVVAGDRFAFATPRGENVTMPTKPGQTAMPFVDDFLPIKVTGPVWGDGATPALARASFATRMGALRTALGGIGTVVTLTAHPPNMGLATATTATIEAQVQRLVLPTPQGWQQVVVEIDLLCLSDPPAWVVA